MFRRLIVALLVVATVGGCANYGQDRYFDTRAHSEAASTGATKDATADRAQVYLMREKVWMQAMVYTPIPPFFYGVDGAMLTVLPIGSYVPLSLEPGAHVFSEISVFGGGIFPLEIKRRDLTVQLEGGKTYYVGTSPSFPSPKFHVIKDADGQSSLTEDRLAKFIYAPVSIDTFTQRVKDRAQGGKQKSDPVATTPARSSTPAAPFAQDQVRDLLPTQAQVASFLEGVATVALVGLLIVGIAMGSPQGSYAPPSLPSPLAPPTTQVLQRTAPPTNWSTGSGTNFLLQMNNGQEGSLLNVSTGVRYRFSDTQILGSDGSIYRISGSRVYSISGEVWNVIGNTVYTSDGRSCTVTAGVVNCN